MPFALGPDESTTPGFASPLAPDPVPRATQAPAPVVASVRCVPQAGRQIVQIVGLVFALTTVTAGVVALAALAGR